MLIKLWSEIHWEAKEQDLSEQAVLEEQLLFIIKWWKVKSRSLLSEGQWMEFMQQGANQGYGFLPIGQTSKWTDDTLWIF